MWQLTALTISVTRQHRHGHSAFAELLPTSARSQLSSTWDCRKGGKQQKPNPASLRTVISKDTWAVCRLFHKEMAPCGWDETVAEDNSSQDQKHCQTQRGLPELFSEPLLKPLVYIKNANRSARMNHPGASQNPKILWRKQVQVHIRLFWPRSKAPSLLSEVNGSTTEKLPEPLENVAIPTLSVPRSAPCRSS